MIRRVIFKLKEVVIDDQWFIWVGIISIGLVLLIGVSEIPSIIPPYLYPVGFALMLGGLAGLIVRMM